MPYGLSDIEIQKLNNAFEQNERIESVMLYGSRAKGTHKPFSDIDLALSGNELTKRDLISILTLVDDLLLPYHVDISIFHTLKNPALREHINRMGIEIYRKKS